MQVIITGVAGFIGVHVAQEMLDRGWNVAGIDDLSGGIQSNVPDGVEFSRRDCCEPLEDLFERFRPDAVVHLAAYAAEGLSHHVPSFNYHNNLIGTSNVLNAAFRAKAKRFVFTSSIAAYGHPSTKQPFDETTPCQPCDPYGIAKHACEQHIGAFREYHGGPDFTIFRPHNVFGPKQNISDPFRNVVGIFFRCIQEGVPLPVFGDGTQTRCFSYIDVVAKSITESLVTEEARNEVFNVGGDQSMSVLELANAVQEVTGSSAGIKHLSERKEVKHASADHRKARSVFPTVFESPVSILEGLKLTAKYLNGREIPPETPCPASIEIEENLPDSWRKNI